MDSIKNLIEEELKRKDDELKKDEEKYIFYNDFFSEMKIINLSNVINSNHSDLSIAIILNTEPTLSVSQVKKIVYGNKKIFEKLNSQSTEGIALLTDFFSKEPEFYEEVKEGLKTGKKIKNRVRKATIDKIEKIIKLLGTTPDQLFAFIDEYMKHGEAYTSALSTVSIIREIQSQKEDCNKMIKSTKEEMSAKVKKKDEEKWISDWIKMNYHIGNLLDSIFDIEKEYLALKKKREKLLAEKELYSQLENNLIIAASKGEITKVGSLLKKISNKEIRMAILQFVYNHNNQIYEEMIKKYEKLSENDAHHYQLLLSKYGISPDLYEVESIMKNSTEDIEKMLKFLVKININSPKELLSIIKNSDLEVINIYQELTEKGIITKELFINHKELFNKNSESYKNFMKNMGLINNKKINPYNFTENEEILLTSHQDIKTNIEILEEYNLLSGIKKNADLSFLGKQNLSQTIDTLLELGFEKNLEETLEILNYKNNIDRLQILKILNIPITKTSDLIHFLTTTKFYVSDEEIPGYIELCNDVKYHLPNNITETNDKVDSSVEINELSKFDNTDRTYNLNGIIISKKKVERNLSHLEPTTPKDVKILYSVLKGSMLNDEEISKVVEAISNKKTTTVKEKNKM